MIDETIVDKLASQNPKWVWWSTHETVEQDIPSVTAILETLIAIPCYWWLTVHFDTYGFLIVSACVAPLVLMRSNESVALGVKWFTNWQKRFSAGVKDSSNLSRYEQAFLFTVCLIVMAGVTWLSLSLATTYLADAERLTAFESGFEIAMGAGLMAATLVLAAMVAVRPRIANSGSPIVLALITLVVGTAATVAAITTIAHQEAATGSWAALLLLLGLLALAAVSAHERKGRPLFDVVFKVIILLLFGFPAGAGFGLGIFIVALCVRIAATLRYPVAGFFSMPLNFRRLVLRTSPIHEPELIPDLPQTSNFSLSAVTKGVFASRKPGETSFEFRLVGTIIAIPILFGPAWLYRFTLKSTTWLWWPLAFIADSPKLAKTPAWQYKAMAGTLMGWMAISIASYTDAAFLVTKFVARTWNEGLPENPLLTPLGYVFMLDWSGRFWPIFSIVGPTISIVTLVWLNRTFSKYETATKHQYQELQRKAERTFVVIERVQRAQFVLLLFYCLLVATQAALYFNGRKCWVSIPPRVQFWSDKIFDDKSPHPICDARQRNESVRTR